MNSDVTIGDVTHWLESLFPLSYQESYDNCGLQTGDSNQKVTGVLTTLDCTEKVLQEAIAKNCNLIVTHHPVIFSGIKRLNGSNLTERILIESIRNNIAIYAIHTNLDNIANQGVNSKIAEVLSLNNLKVLSPLKGRLKKLATYVPKVAIEEVKAALASAGAGVIGDYDQCSFIGEGIGSFRANENAKPFIGAKEVIHQEEEFKLEMIFPDHLQKAVCSALLKAHPYEEPAFDIYSLDNEWKQAGAGLIGELENEMSPTAFLDFLRNRMELKVIRHTPLDRKILKVAICGGSGSFLLSNAIQMRADAFVTADFKYHQFFDADGKLMIADIGHFESEKFTRELLKDLILKKFTTFAVLLSEINTNPINYH